MSDPVPIRADVVKRLRDMTGAGMMDCKQALIEADGDLDKAQEILRARGKAGARKRESRTATEGCPWTSRGVR